MRKLTTIEYIGIIGSVASVVGLVLYFFPSNNIGSIAGGGAGSVAPAPSVNSTAIGSGNVSISGNNNSVSLPREDASKTGRLNLVGNTNSDIPADFLSHIKPGVSMELVRDAMGPPIKKYKVPKASDSDGRQWVSFVYRLKNAFVQIDTDDNDTAGAVTVVLTDGQSKLKIWPLDYTIGGAYSDHNVKYTTNETTIGDVVGDRGACDAPSVVISARMDYGYTKCWFGRPGAYLNFIFGSERMSVPFDSKNKKLIKWNSIAIDYVVLASEDVPLDLIHSDGVSIYSELRF